jgi:DNA-binding LytR/AlgR family response regulator
VDDEPMARKVLEEYIEDVDFLTLVGKAENPVKAGAVLDANKVDVMFLDINMPRMSGIDFLKSTSKLPLTVMTTAYSEYAVEGFELDVLDYLVKPFSFDRFLKAVTKAKEYVELQNKPAATVIDQTNNYFFTKCNGKIEKVFYDDLILRRSDDELCRFTYFR